VLTMSLTSDHITAAGPQVDWSRLLDRAISGTGIEVHLQPIVDISQRTIAGYESLARFESDPRLPPNEWFAAARALDVVPELELAVLRRSLNVREDLPPGCFLSINVEPDALVDCRIAELLLNQRSLRGLVLELTEHIDTSDISGLSSLISDLRSLGAKVAVDDAGSGYSGLQRILELQPDYLKLDRSLVMDLDRNDANSALVEMFAGFASRIDAWLIAEGVERPGELERLRRLHVPLVQGYLLARPAAGYIGISATGQAVLAATTVIDDEESTIRSILETAAWVVEHELDEAGRILAQRSDLDIVVVIDADRRPVGCVDRSTTHGEMGPVWRAWAGTPLREFARRIVTRPADGRFASTVCCDAAGRFLGVVRLERLLFELAG
jgi:EAL domain-containing protein (putative c-di-GMP-specific phosphodiesterase class I)